ncbi:MAG TPA: cell wall anchor protein [Lachnospiraceae bacterium]|nr:cell wall anchor protein [Lachnospiraceae bacterium]
MKKLKKILAFVMAMAMVLGMSVTTFAEPLVGTKPTDGDKAEVVVKNVEAGATITAYRIVKADYDTAGFKGYIKAADALEIVEPTAPTSEEIIKIAKMENLSMLGLESVTNNNAQASEEPNGFVASAAHESTDPKVKGKVDYTASLKAGYWLVLVTGTTADVYNPMLLGVYYQNADGTGNTIEGGDLDSNTKWTLNGTEVYAKSTKPTIDKKIVNSDGKMEDGKITDAGNDVAVGSSVSFQIDTVIPSYSSEYESAIVKITDELSEGLELDKTSIVVNVNNVPVAPTSDAKKTYTVNTETTGKIEIVFDSEYVLDKDTRDDIKNVTVTYTAKLTNKAGVNFVPNTNKATLVYSNNPSNSASTNKVDDKTYTYTFAIGAWTNGVQVEGDNRVTEETSEIVKVDENGNLIVLESNTVTTEVPGTKVTVVAEGAEFALKDSNGTTVAEGKTDKNGRLQFTGLDAGSYKLVETKAPTGFQLDKTEHDVEISAVYNDNGTLASYTIKIDGKATNTYQATYKAADDGREDEIEEINKTVERTEIKNTNLSSLPSTGGIGTTIFTIGGCAIMILAAGLFFASRRKSAK